MLSKILKGCAVVALFLLVLTGCSTPEAGQPGGPAPAMINIWHSLQGSQENALKDQIKKINDEHPEVIAKLHYVPEANFVNKSYQSEAAGEGPEIFIASREIIHQLYSRGALAPIAYKDEEAFPAALACFRYGKESYGLPWLTDIPLLYFRTDLTELPERLGQLFAGRGLSVATANTATLSAWWNGQGGALTGQGKPALNSPENIAFLQQLSAWRRDGVMGINPEALAEFINGDISLIVTGAGAAKQLTQLKVPWGSVPMSNVLEGQGQSLIGETLGIANSAVKTTPELTDAIQTVERALLTPEVEGVLYEAGTLLPANMNFYKREEAQKGVFPQANTAFTQAWRLEGDAPERELIPLQDLAWNNVLAGIVTAEDGLNTAQEEAEKAILAKGQP